MRILPRLAQISSPEPEGALRKFARKAGFPSAQPNRAAFHHPPTCGFCLCFILTISLAHARLHVECPWRWPFIHLV